VLNCLPPILYRLRPAAENSILSEQSIVPLIIVSPTPDPVESINGILRRAGHPVQCTWIPALRDLADAMTQLNPELLVCVQSEPQDLAAAVKVRDMAAAEVPLVVLAEQIDENTIAEAMLAGARDVVSLVHPMRLQAVMARELRAFRLERALNHTLQSARDYRRQLETVLQRSADAIGQVQEGIVVEANSSWLELFGFDDRAAVVGQPLMDLFDEASHAALKGALVACLQGRWSDHVLKATANLADGTLLPLEFVLAPGEHEGEPCVRLIVPARRRDDRALAGELEDALLRDSATGLLHRRALLAAVNERLALPALGGVRYLALVKPDKFAAVEREIGVAASEEFLGEFAALIKASTSAKDIIGRFGGTTLLVLLERGNERDVEAWCEQLVSKIGKHIFRLDEKTLSTTCTIGLALVPHGKPSLDAPLADALEALRRARGQGGNQFQTLVKADADTRVQAYDKVWVKHIKSALLENRFRLVQQPIASLRGDDPQMFDVLVRMLDHQGKEVLPSEFMPAAERNELLKNIDRWVIGASLSFAAQRKPGCLFIRLSKDSALDGSLPDWLETQLRATRVEPERICFQVTEEIAATHLTSIGTLSKAMRAKHFRFALERFGSGRDPQGLLTSIGLDFVKIDGALVQGLAASTELQSKVRALVEAATQRKIQTIAERVEDANTMAVLWQLGVQYIQGYFVHAPEEIVL
jgi:multidomain signaling protein FimX